MDDRHYRAIAAFYGDRVAERSGVPLIAHIDEGLAILERIGASRSAQQAFCIHPLVQQTADLQRSLGSGSILLRHDPDPIALLLAMEYRAVANAYLSQHYRDEHDPVALSPLAEVNQMLVADKVQNRKDFERFHAASHPHAADLARYFQNWLRALQVSEQRYAELALAAR